MVVPQGAAAEVRRLLHARERLVAHQTALRNQLEALVFLLFPELLQVMGSVGTQTVQHLVRQYGTPQAIAAQEVAVLATELRRVSRGHYGQDRAAALVEAAHQSVGVRAGQAGLVQEIHGLLDLLTQVAQQRTAAETALQEQVAQIPASQYLFSIPGVGLITVAGLLGEIGDFAQYPTAATLEKLAGLNLYEVSSGQHQGQKRISKRGRTVLRKILYFGALNTIREGQAFHGKYQQLRARGKPPLKALIAIARKLLRVGFALVRDHQYFDPARLGSARAA